MAALETTQTTAAPTSPGLARRIEDRRVAPGTIACWWLGGSGFVFKTPGGAQIYIDPYLSDIVREIFGVGRAFPAPLRPDEVNADVIIATHWHEDHLDPGAIPQIARANTKAKFVMPPGAMARALSWGIPRDRVLPLSAGQTLEAAGVSIAHTPARHDAGWPGWETPDAMGVILRAEGLSIYNSGDTEYFTGVRLLRPQKVDVATICINGVGGNMNAHEAALLAWQLGARVVMPMHHYLWETPAGGNTNDEATLDPQLFADTYRRLGGKGKVVLPVIGEEMSFSADAGHFS